MPALQGAVETAPVSRLHEKQSYDPRLQTTNDGHVV